MKDGKFEVDDKVKIIGPMDSPSVVDIDIFNGSTATISHFPSWSYEIGVKFGTNKTWYYPAASLELIETVASSSNDLKDTNPKDAAATTRLDLTLFPDTAVAYGALAFTEGCKYGAYNYREKGASISTYIASTRRHLVKFYNGEWADKKTGVPHLANALAGIAIIIDGFAQGNIVDDRPPSVDMDKLLTEFEDKVKHLREVFPNMKPRCTELSRHEEVIAAVSSFNAGPFYGMFDGDDGGDL